MPSHLPDHLEGAYRQSELIARHLAHRDRATAGICVGLSAHWIGRKIIHADESTAMRLDSLRGQLFADSAYDHQIAYRDRHVLRASGSSENERAALQMALDPHRLHAGRMSVCMSADYLDFANIFTNRTHQFSILTLNFSEDGEGSAHAIATHKPLGKVDGQSLYCCFDPNIGEFQIPEDGIAAFYDQLKDYYYSGYRANGGHVEFLQEIALTKVSRA